MIQWLPFAAIIEHPAYPFARIYRRNCWGRKENVLFVLYDTFEVLVGNHYQLDNRPFRIGILDILIFPGISALLASFLLGVRDEEWAFVIIALFTPLEILRAALGAVLALIAFPIVAFVHFCAYFKATSLKRAFQKATVSVIEEKEEQVTGSSKKLSEVCPDERFAEVKISVKRRASSGEEEKSLNPAGPIEQVIINFNSRQMPNDKGIDIVVNEKNAPAIEIMLKLNIGDILNKLAGAGVLEHLQEEITRGPKKQIREAFVQGFGLSPSSPFQRLLFLPPPPAGKQTILARMPLKNTAALSEGENTVTVCWQNDDKPFQKVLDKSNLPPSMCDFFPPRGKVFSSARAVTCSTLVKAVSDKCAPVPAIKKFQENKIFDSKTVELLFEFAGIAKERPSPAAEGLPLSAPGFSF